MRNQDGSVLIIAVIVVMLFGPDKLPKLARTIGRFMSEFKRYQAMMESTLRAEMYLTEEPTDRFKKAGEYQDKLKAEREAAEAEASAETGEGGNGNETEPVEEEASSGSETTVIDGIEYDEEGEPIIAPEDSGWVPGTPDAPATEPAAETGEEAEERP